MSQRQNQPRLTAEEIEVRVWATVVVIVAVILAGVVAFMLYSLAFVTQPIKTMAPIDQAFTKMLNDIILLIVGGIGGVMSRKGVQALSENMATKQQQDNDTIIVTNQSQQTKAPASVMPNFNWMGFKNPDLDENWRAPPPPNTPPDYVDPASADIAVERHQARSEA